jgi:fucose 4-O-acetylase-like acetyltransferase
MAATTTLDRPLAATPRTGRDGSIDAVRATLLVTVVALHATMVGVSVGAAGPVLENALEGRGWFAPVSWVVQVMPLFFIVGGFSSATQWRGVRARGATPATYVRARVERLVRPAVALVAIVGAALATMTLVGVPADIVATAGYRIGQPLWFLGVYILCSALVPAMVRAHERARLATPLLLLAAVVAVDATRLTSGVAAVGFLNLLFVWLLVQQLGFWLADGAVDRLRRRARAAVLVAALASLLGLTSGPYPADMFVNLNPPTVCLVVLGVAQLMVFSLLRSRFTALAAWTPARRAIAVLGERGMTVYLWHLPVLIALAAVLLVLEAAGVPLPEPVSPEWWAGRPLWLAAAALAVAPVVAALSRFERGGRAATAAGVPLFVAVDAVLGAGGVAVVLVAGFSPVPASVALVLLTVSLLGTARIAGGARRTAVALRYRAGSFQRMMPAEPPVDARIAAAS